LPNVTLPENPSASLTRLNPHLFGVKAETGKLKLETLTRERELHDQIVARGWLVCHSRMDMASTVAVGFPDFVIFMPGARTVFLECKRAGGKATTAQLAKLAHARKLGFRAEIVTSMEEVCAALAHED
jgi:VRR-NUC domain